MFGAKHAHRGYYLVLALSAASLRMAGPYGALWMVQNVGVFGLFVRQVVYAAAQGLMNYPTGVLADKWGRKKTYALGYTLVGLSFLILGSRLTIVSLVMSSALVGAGLALASGALEAWITDEVRQSSGHRPYSLEKVFSTGDAISFGAMALGGVLGSVAYMLRGLQYPMYAAGIAGLLAAVATIVVLRENYGNVQKMSYVEVLQRGVKVVIANRSIRLLSIATLVFATGYQVFGMVDAPFLSERNVSRFLLGVIFAATDGFTSVGSFVAGRLMPKVKDSFVAISSTISWGVGVILLGMAKNPIVVAVAYVVLDAVFGIRAPSLKAWRNRVISADMRATVLSAIAAIAFLGSTFILALMAGGARMIGIDGLILVAGGLGCASVVPLIGIYREGLRAEHSKQPEIQS